MIKSRINHWNCSKFADLIRGTKKPYSLGWDEWKLWHKNAETKHPLRYYLAEKILNRLQDILYFPYDIYHTVKIYIRNRWIDQTHIIKTGLKPGEYYEFDHKILHGLFNELVDYVEIELAHLSKWDDPKKYVFKNGRSKQAGLDYLNWASSLTFGDMFGINENDPDFNKLTDQAISSSIIKDLYLWWTEIRPNRLDPVDLYDNTEETKPEVLDKIHEIDSMYDDEDTEMLIHLVSIRKDIWC